MALSVQAYLARMHGATPVRTATWTFFSRLAMRDFRSGTWKVFVANLNKNSVVRSMSSPIEQLSPACEILYTKTCRLFMKDDAVLLGLMLDAFGKIREFIAAMSYEDFSKNSMAQSAVIMQLQVIGELAKRVSDPTRAKIDVPWKQMAGLRDLVAHNYFSLDIKVVWQTVSESAKNAEEKIHAHIART